MTTAPKDQPTLHPVELLPGVPPEMWLFRDEDFELLSEFLHSKLKSADFCTAMSMLCAAMLNSPLRATVDSDGRGPSRGCGDG
jgi:hypothetical protein